ncbi:MAG TPA: endonuclease/exonuclease/phosphatase family protein [Flavisolibacter sp.]|nr:endonuclease/exonuclease/phosphatase family protein [Flavisolibacter sp.]
MKTLIAIFLVLSSVSTARSQEELNVMSFNIRLNHAGDSLNAWPYRKDKVASQILFHQVHLLGVQEALHEQMVDLRQRLPSYKYVGVGRADGKEKGEYSAIFYGTVRIRLLNAQTFWLAEKTDEPGLKGWDAAIERIVTWAFFEDRVTGKRFYHFNTHFDHVGKVARRESAALLLRKTKQIAGNAPVIVTGDLNANPSDEPVQVLIDSTNVDHFTDAKQISAQAHYGPTGTFNGFRSKETSDLPIDYIFVRNGIGVLRHATLSQTWQGRFSSDHFPVLAVLKIAN